MMRLTTACICIFLLIFCISGCMTGTKQPSPSTPDEPLTPLEVVVLKSGKSDATLIKWGEHAMVIDTGEKDDAKKLVAALKERNINKIDYLILTHLDKDHIGGAAGVLEQIEVEHLIQANYSVTTKPYEQYVNACNERGITPTLLSEPLDITLSDARIRILPGAKSNYTNENDYSIMTEIHYGKKKFLFAADALTDRLREYLADDAGHFDFVKMPHHGEACGMTNTFIRQVTPTYAVITCSDKNLPDAAVLAALAEIGSMVWLTNENNVTATCDGIDLTVK